MTITMRHWLRARIGSTLRRYLPAGQSGLHSVELGHVGQGVTIDSLRLMPDGCVVVVGWAPGPVAEMTLLQGDRPVPRLALYRTYRADVMAALNSGNAYLGFEVRFQPLDPGQPKQIRLLCGEQEVHAGSVRPWRPDPHYALLRDTRQIYGRENIYGSGPPIPSSTDEVLALATALKGRTLDFGCGAGYLVARMRAEGIDAHGIEIDRPEIHQSLLDEVHPYVRLTDGGLPLPYGDDEFDNIIATEVIEHVSEPAAVIAELARVASKRVVITVPDASAIPDLASANVVPWHLLESTHYHFFNINSLEALLAPHFRDIHFAKIGRVVTNGIPWNTSLVAMCGILPK